MAVSSGALTSPLLMIVQLAVEENNQPNNCFHHEANWHLLELDTANPIRDPNNVLGLVAPTTNAVGGTVEPVKYNFTDSFDREPFVALAKENQLDRNRKVKKDRDHVKKRQTYLAIFDFFLTYHPFPSC
jgi:hypothetical protein